MIKATIKNVASLSFVMLLMASIGTTVSAQNMLIGEDIVIDGDFSGGALSSAWTVEIPVGSADIGAPDGELSFTNLEGQANQWEAQAYQVLSVDQIATLSQGGNWELSFDARTTVDSTKTFHVFLGHNGGGWERYWSSPGDGDVTVDGEMKTYTLKTEVTETWDAMKLGFEVAADNQDLFIDNVVLRRVEDNLLYDGEVVIGEDSLSAAWTQLTSPASATFSADNGEVMISDITGIVNPWDVQFVQELDSAQVDSIMAGPYEMFFDARTSSEAGTKTIQVFFGNNGTGGDWTNWAPTIELTDSMQTYPLNITATQNWESMKIGFEVSGDDSPVWFDNIIVRRVRDVPPAAPVVNLTTENGIVTISVDAVEGAATYEVFFADSAFADTDGGGSVGVIDSEEGLTLQHSTFAPHPDLVESFTAHYGVVAIKENGTTSLMTSSSIVTDMGVRPNYIAQLSDSDVNATLEAVSGGTVPTAETLAGYFPEGYVPFEVNEANRSIENGTGGDGDSDISGKMWVGYENGSGQDYLIIYTEISDDVLVFAPSECGAECNPGGAAWNFDSYEIGIGAYEPASIITGSDHTTFGFGDEPDYQIRGGFFNDDQLFVSLWTGSAGTADNLIGSSITVGEVTDGGYRLLSVISTLQFSLLEPGNDNFDFPDENSITTIPFQVAFNDNDDTARDTQISWSSKAGQDDWWNNPSRWETISMAGMNKSYTSGVSNEFDGENPFSYSLEQNYPNPFNPSTNIEFTLASASNVTLEVYNMLGQRVATLLSGEKLTAGEHSQLFDASSLASGMYLYRLSTDNFSQTRKMMLIK